MDSVAAGGSLSGEHGGGLEKQAAMELLFTPEDLAAMVRVRDVWNPDDNTDRNNR